MQSRQRRIGSGQVIVLASLLALTTVLFIDVCDLVFGCGCDSLWRGAAAACNIHHTEPPHCPWCAHPYAAGGSTFLLVALAQIALVLGWGPFGRLPGGLWLRAGLGLVAFPTLALLLGSAQASWYGYGS